MCGFYYNFIVVMKEASFLKLVKISLFWGVPASSGVPFQGVTWYM